MDIQKEIQGWVREARLHAGLSGAELGAKLALHLGTERGHTKGNISHWELGRHQPNVQQLLAISKITGFPLPASITNGIVHGLPGAPAATPELLIARHHSERMAAPPAETRLQYVTDQEATLLDLFRATDAEGRQSIIALAEQMPSIIHPRVATN